MTISAISRVLLLCLSASVCGALPSRADSIPLNVNPGLWQVTSTGQASGTPPIPAEDLAKLTPAQQAMVASAMASAMNRASKPRVSKECVTAEIIARGLNPDPGDKCQQTVVSSSATTMDETFQCTGKGKPAGTVHFEASSPTAVTGTIDMTMTDGVHTMTMTRSLQATWLSADCGTVTGDNN